MPAESSQGASGNPDRIKAAILAGKKVEAIKLYHDQTGAGLAVAKDYVAALEAKLRSESPGAFQEVQAAAGCEPVLIGVGFLAVSVVWLLLGAYDVWPRPGRLLQSHRTVGTISAIVKGDDAADSLVVDYRVDDQPLQVRHMLRIDPSRPYQVGQQVRVLYGPGNPADAMVDTLPEVWPQVLLTFVLPAILVAATGIAIFAWRQRSLSRLFASAERQPDVT